MIQILKIKNLVKLKVKSTLLFLLVVEEEELLLQMKHRIGFWSKKHLEVSFKDWDMLNIKIFLRQLYQVKDYLSSIKMSFMDQKFKIEKSSWIINKILRKNKDNWNIWGLMKIAQIIYALLSLIHLIKRVELNSENHKHSTLKTTISFSTCNRWIKDLVNKLLK